MSNAQVFFLKQMGNIKLLRGLSSIAIIAMVFICLFQFKQGSNIETDLTSMLPTQHFSPTALTATNQLNTYNSSKLIVTLQANDEGMLDELEYEFSEWIEQNTELEQAISEAVIFEHFAPLIQKELSYFLIDSDLERWSKTELSLLISEELSKQRSLFNFQIIPFKEDPLGSANRFLNTALNKFNQNEFESSSKNLTIDDKAELYRTQVLMLSAKSSSNLNNLKITLSQLREKTNALKTKYDAKIFIVGVPAFTEFAAHSAEKDVNLIASISGVGIFALCIFVFRSIRPLLLALSSIGVGLLVGLTICNIVFESIHLLSFVFGAALIGVVVDFTIHFALHSGNAKIILKPMLLSLLSSIVGYSALIFTGLHGLKEIALFSIAGLASACGFVLLWGNYFLGKSIRTTVGWPKIYLLSAARFALISKFLPVFALSGLVACFALYKIDAVQFKSDPRALYASSPELLNDALRIADKSNAPDPSRLIVVTASDEQALSSNLERINSFLQEQKNAGRLEDYRSLHDWLPSLHRQAINLEAFQSLMSAYSNEQLIEIAETLGLQSDLLSSLNEKVRTRSSNDGLTPTILDTEIQNVLGSFWFKESNDHHIAFIHLIGIKDEMAIANFTKASSNTYWLNQAQEIQNGLLKLQGSALNLLLLSYLMIFLLLGYYLNFQRSIQLVSVPLISTVLIIIGFSIAQVPLSLFHVLAMYLVLGLGIDYSIFMSNQYKALGITKIAVSMSAATSVLSFGLLSSSSTPFIQHFGSVVLLGSLLNLLFSFFCKPTHQFDTDHKNYGI